MKPFTDYERKVIRLYEGWTSYGGCYEDLLLAHKRNEIRHQRLVQEAIEIKRARGDRR